MVQVELYLCKLDLLIVYCTTLLSIQTVTLSDGRG